MFRAPAEVATRLLHEAIAHQALGHDYIVSPGLVTARRERRSAWPNMLGACTPIEAIAMGGAKARMYQMAPLSVEPNGTFSVNLGTWLDLAVMNFTPGLRSALKAALAPSTIEHPDDSAERRAVDYLLAIRGRLGELLLARDAIFRLTRREALGPDWVRPFDQGAAAGVGGNDLTAMLAYHLTAALNGAFSVRDNLAWVYASRDLVDANTTTVGFSQLVSQEKGRRFSWKNGATVSMATAALASAGQLPFVLAARQMRNAHVHREGIDYGALEWDQQMYGAPRGVSGLWVEKNSLQLVTVATGQDIHPFEALRRRGNYANDDFAVFTFSRFVDRLSRDVSALIGVGLGAVAWPSSRAWSLPPTSGRTLPRHYWRAREQRRLWDL